MNTMTIHLELSFTLDQATNLVLLSQAGQRLAGGNWRIQQGAVLAGAIGQKMHEAFNEPMPTTPRFTVLPPVEPE